VLLVTNGLIEEARAASDARRDRHGDERDGSARAQRQDGCASGSNYATRVQ
jgi:hypothetical protein